MSSQRVGAAVLGLAAVVLAAGCQERTVGAAGGTGPVAPTPGPVRFRIEEQGAVKRGDSETRIWLATHQMEGKTARFQIKLTLKPAKARQPLAFTSGVLYGDSKSDSSVLLLELARALDARRVPPAPRKKEGQLAFTAALLGQGLSRAAGTPTALVRTEPDAAPKLMGSQAEIAGSFNQKPRGPWIATKVFVADGEGEFFLNLDPVAGVGEIALKDSDYGDIVMKELVKVL
jgi:hypothetical protein